MLSAIIGFVLSNPTILAIIGGIVAALGFGYQQRRAGRKAERAKQDRERLESITEAQRIDEAIAGRDPDKNREELGRWSPWGKH